MLFKTHRFVLFWAQSRTQLSVCQRINSCCVESVICHHWGTWKSTCRYFICGMCFQSESNTEPFCQSATFRIIRHCAYFGDGLLSVKHEWMEVPKVACVITHVVLCTSSGWLSLFNCSECENESQFVKNYCYFHDFSGKVAIKRPQRNVIVPKVLSDYSQVFA